MKYLASLIVTIALTNVASAAEWSRIDQKTISMVGRIEPKELESFLAVYDNDVELLVVDSGGGDVEGGLSIGEFILDKKMAVEVKGICISSCANYIFVAAERKIIHQGIVGYHGNTTAAFAGVTEGDLKAMFIQAGYSEADADKMYSQLVNELIPREQAFFKALGVSQELFERTQRPDKGMGSGLYSALLPKAETFLKYGIVNVIGEQSQYVIEHDPRIRAAADAGMPVLVD